MTIYHTETQEDYDALMIILEEKGRKWICGNEPTFFKFWKTYKESTCIIISDKGITFGNIEQYKKQYPDTPIIEYKAKGENMKIYHVETQGDYDALMIELEEKGHRWLTGVKPTEHNYWEEYKEDGCVIISSKYITFINIEQSKKQHPNIPVIEYKAKGE